MKIKKCNIEKEGKIEKEEEENDEIKSFQGNQESLKNQDSYVAFEDKDHVLYYEDDDDYDKPEDDEEEHELGQNAIFEKDIEEISVLEADVLDHGDSDAYKVKGNAKNCKEKKRKSLSPGLRSSISAEESSYDDVRIENTGKSPKSRRKRKKRYFFYCWLTPS